MLTLAFWVSITSVVFSEKKLRECAIQGRKMQDLDNPLLSVCWKILASCMATITPKVQLQILSRMKWNSRLIKQHCGDSSVTQSSGDGVVQKWWGVYNLLNKDLGGCEKLSENNEPGSCSELHGEHEDLLAVWAGRSNHFEWTFGCSWQS